MISREGGVKLRSITNETASVEIFVVTVTRQNPVFLLRTRNVNLAFIE
jgi:hypothetical protein